MSNYFLFLLLTNWILAGCMRQGGENAIQSKRTLEKEDAVAKRDYSGIELIDRFDNALLPNTASQMTEAQFSPLFLGDVAPEISLSYKPWNLGNRAKITDDFKRPDTKCLAISVDTSRKIGSPMSIYEDYEKREYRDEMLAYPVCIENIGADTLAVGYGDIFPIVMEAQDENRLWRPIQSPFMYFCGTDLTDLYLAPDQIAITAMKLFDGNFRTKLRLAYGPAGSTIYSNEIDARINKEQFNSEKAY